MFGWIGVAAVGHEHALGHERELEGLVLGATTHALAEIQSRQWVRFVGGNQ
jgi:hypothetical protein